MNNVQEIFKRSSPWMRLSICTNLHIKKALLNLLHNRIKEPQVKAIPDDSTALYTFLQIHKNKIKKSTHIKEYQKSILLPTNSQHVDSVSLDISLIRFLIQTFNGIKNANNDWKKPAPTDQTLCAYVFRAADFRNQICHDNDVDKLDEATFEKKWKELKDILKGLKYDEDIEDFKTKTLEFDKLEYVILEEFVEHLRSYKEECLNEPTQDDYIQRRLYFNRNENNIAIEPQHDTESGFSGQIEEYDESDIATEAELENIIKDNDCVMIYAEAGMGKSSLAKRIRNEWCNENILKDLYILYFDSKKMNKQLKVQSHAAPLFFSELEHYLKKNGRTEDDLSIYSCVKTTIEKLIILIDGIDEFPIRDLVNKNYIDELERKVKNNEKISSAETIVAIYFGFLFPNTKICLLGRNNEFERLKEFLSYNTNRTIKDLELLKFNDANVQEFTCLNICKQQSNGQRNCIGTCNDIYEEIKNIELCQIPTDLNSVIKLHKKHPNENIGRITRTKLIIATLLNRLNEHVNRKNNFPCKTFSDIRKQKDFSKYLEGIRTLGEISFKSLLADQITVRVEEEQDTDDGIVHFKYKNEISIERKTIEELDLFYVRDFDYYFILEPHHTLNIEFLSACYLFSHPDEWDLILKLRKDRHCIIISFIAGLHADDYFTKDFAKNVLKTSSYSLEQFFSWLYNVGERLPDVYDKNPSCWFGLMENQKLTPSFFLLDYISHEVEIPQKFIPNTIVCFCHGSPSFEWYDMNFFKYNILTQISDKLNIELFLKKFPTFKFIVKGNIVITNEYELNRLDQFGANNQITFKINELTINKPVDICFSSNFNVNTLEIREECDSRTIGMMLNALSPPPTNISSSTIKPRLKCKRLVIRNNIKRFNLQQTEKLFELCLYGVVDTFILYFPFFADGQLAILENVERNSQNLINIVLYSLQFNHVFDLPHLGNRHICLRSAENVTEKDVIKFRGHIPLVSQGCRNNFSNYKIVGPVKPFVRKKNSSQDVEQSMYLNLCRVDFKNVSPEVFAKTFSLVPSLSCVDDSYDYIIYDSNNIPPSHWLKLSQIDNCQINELRIWEPRKKNFEHFLNIKTKMVQFIFPNIYNGKDKLKQLLDHIVNNQNIPLEKEI